MTCAACFFPTCNESVCPTRMGAAREGFHTLVQQFNGAVRLGLTIFPADNVCSPAGTNQQLVAITPANDSAGELKSLAGRVDMMIQSQTVGGGTPTGSSIAFTGTIPQLNDPTRDDYVLLITDGLPNCNPMNPNTCTNATQCKCTLNGGQCGTTVNDSDANNFCRRGCLDQTGTTGEVAALRSRGIRTIVVGFGSDVASGDAAAVFSAMAAAGGWERRCPTGTECGMSGTCDTASAKCTQPYYLARNGAELSTALEQITAALERP
jgi:hypothetical protein